MLLVDISKWGHLLFQMDAHFTGRILIFFDWRRSMPIDILVECLERYFPDFKEVLIFFADRCILHVYPKKYCKKVQDPIYFWRKSWINLIGTSLLSNVYPPDGNQTFPSCSNFLFFCQIKVEFILPDCQGGTNRTLTIKSATQLWYYLKELVCYYCAMVF